MPEKIMCPHCSAMQLFLPDMLERSDSGSPFSTAVYVKFPVEWTLHVAVEHPAAFEEIVQRCVEANHGIRAMPRDVDGTLLARGAEVGASYRELAAPLSPTEPTMLGHWLRALSPRTILTDRDGTACQIDVGEEHIHRSPHRRFRALVIGGHPFEISEGHEQIGDLARCYAPFTVLKRGSQLEDSGDAS